MLSLLSFWLKETEGAMESQPAGMASGREMVGQRARLYFEHLMWARPCDRHATYLVMVYPHSSVGSWSIPTRPLRLAGPTAVTGFKHYGLPH